MQPGGFVKIQIDNHYHSEARLFTCDTVNLITRISDDFKDLQNSINTTLREVMNEAVKMDLFL